MPKKLTLEEFKQRAAIIHDNFYDYSKFIYINISTKGIIICPEHGEFKQIPNDHLNKHGCQGCRIKKIKKIRSMPKEEFIKRANVIYDYKYDYSFIEYTNNRTKVKIICPEHGEFFQRPDDHLRDHSCPSCGNVKKLILNDFIIRSNKIHDNKYNYSKITEITNNRTKVIIICLEHGEFSQTPHEHLSGHGCQKCPDNSKKTFAEFKQKAAHIHESKYIYFEEYFVNMNTKIPIECKYHGIFFQKPSAHAGGQGCPHCFHFVSDGEIAWLNILNIQETYRHKTLVLDKKRYNVDAYVPDTNTIYEFYGDYWHGNPEKFDPDKLNKNKNVSFKFLYEKTIEREKALKSYGYNVISIWENDFNKLNKENQW